MRRSLYPSGLAVRALASDAHTDGTVNGDTVDRYQTSGGRGSYHGGVLFVVLTGTVTDGTHTFVVEDSENGSTWATASSYDVQGAAPALDDQDSDAVFEVGYNGTKRYVRLSVTTAGSTTGGVFGAVALLDGGQARPV